MNCVFLFMRIEGDFTDTHTEMELNDRRHKHMQARTHMLTALKFKIDF